LVLIGDGDRSLAWNGGGDTCFLACGDGAFDCCVFELGFIGGFLLAGSILRSVIISFIKT